MTMAELMCDRIFMIFRGRAVLDGPLADIQATYGRDTIRVRVAGGAPVVAAMPAIERFTDHGNMQEVRVGMPPQAWLRELVSRTDVRHFEIARPSLHDIFVDIARPSPEEDA